MILFYRKTVIGLVTRSITEFSLHFGHNTITTTHTHIRQQLLLPDIWVDGKKLYQYQTTFMLNDRERQRYMLTYDKLLDPYEYVEDFTPVIQYILQT